MARPPKEGVKADAVLNIRLTHEDAALLARSVEAQKADIAARTGLDPAMLDVTRASVIRTWIREDAKRRGWLPAPAQGVLFAEEPPPVVPVTEPPAEEPVVPVSTTDVKTLVAAAPDLAAAVQEAAAREPAPVVPVEVDVAELAPVVPVAEHEAPAVRAAVIAALKKGAKQRQIAKDAGISETSLSRFKTDERELPAAELAAVAAVAVVAAELAAKPKRRRAK